MGRAQSILRSRWTLLVAGSAAIVLIAWADLELDKAIPLALLYLAPIAAMSTTLRRWQIVLLGGLCATVAEFSDAFPWTVAQGVPRDALYFFAYTAAGLYVYEMVRRRRAEQIHVTAMEAEMETRRSVEEQLRLVVANSSIAIVTSDESGVVLEANEAAERLFGGSRVACSGSLKGQRLEAFMPSLARVQIGKQGWEQLRTMMQCQGFRSTKDPFLADVWFSTYVTTSGGRLTAMIIDSSVETRDREQANLEQVLVGSRIAIGALSHEIRNICAAISVVQQNLLGHTPSKEQMQEFDALRQLVDALERMASVELSLVKRQAARLQLDTFLRDLYIVIHASLSDTDIALEWWVEPNLPDVWADPPSLLQVFLNLVRNTERAVAGMPGARLRVCAGRAGERVQITVADNGPGVPQPEQLFRPFAVHAGATGLGLYLSRAMMRSFHGDLRYVAGQEGATFTVDLDSTEGEEV